MFQGAIIILCIFIVLLAACILPWWFIPSAVLSVLPLPFPILHVLSENSSIWQI